jgi:hypothetical protein
VAAHVADPEETVSNRTPSHACARLSTTWQGRVHPAELSDAADGAPTSRYCERTIRAVMAAASACDSLPQV